MRKLFQIASLALMGLMLVSAAPASAASGFGTPPKPVVADATICTAICGAPIVLLERHVDIVPIDPCAPHLTGGGILQPTRAVLIREVLDAPKGRPHIVCGGKLALSDCAAPLGHLPDISEREVRSVDRHDRVKLIPICDRMNASLTQAQQNLAEHGNAESLVPAIARNTVLTAALGHARYRADDVVGIVMGTNSVMLYVHKM